MFSVKCQCERRLKLKIEHLGRLVTCPACGAPIRAVSGPEPTDGVFQFVLTVVDGPAQIGEQVFLGGHTVLSLGKLSTSDIPLSGKRVSRQHCRLAPTGDGWTIEDTDSRNGVIVNDRRVESCALEDGDRVRLADFELEVRDTLMFRMGPEAAPVPRDDRATLPESAVGGRHALAPEGDSPPSSAGRSAPPAEGPVCPSCQTQLAVGAKICVTCGIDLRTGRSMLTADESGMDETYATAEEAITVVSWIVPLGLYPIASEAFGKRQPHVIRIVALLTIAATVWLWCYDWADSPKFHKYKDLLLWSGEAEPDGAYLTAMCEFGEFGDIEAVRDKAYELDPTESGEDPIVAAHASLPAEDRCIGTYHHAQLFTHALFHADVLHLVGNLLFLMVLGTRVNALIGALGTAVVYPLLAIAGGIAHMLSTVEELPHPMLGASGAIMGLAGMYLVLFPAHKVHMAIWYRWWFYLRFNLFTMRGIWVIAFYIAFDVFYTALGIKDGTAHWAHLGGFIVGMALATILLLTRSINARGGDLFSVLMGKRAWSLVGKPNMNRKALFGG